MMRRKPRVNKRGGRKRVITGKRKRMKPNGMSKSEHKTTKEEEKGMIK